MPNPRIMQQINLAEHEKNLLEQKIAFLNAQLAEEQYVDWYIQYNSLGLDVSEQSVLNWYKEIENFLAAENSIENKIVELFIAARNILLIEILLDYRRMYDAGANYQNLTNPRILKIIPLFFEIETDDDILQYSSYYEDLVQLAIEMQQHKIIKFIVEVGVRLSKTDFLKDFLVNAIREKSSYEAWQTSIFVL